MAGWTITTYTFIGAQTTSAISGLNATLSGPAVFLDLDDTNAGGLSWRVSTLNKQLIFSWSTTLGGSGTYTVAGRFDDPTVTNPQWELVATAILLTSLPVGPSPVYQQFIGSEANPRFTFDTNGLHSWGPGGGTAVDTTLQRIAAGILQVQQIRSSVGAPSNIADLTRKDYVDSQVATRVAKAGDTMTGLLTLSGDPVANLQAATKQYVDSKAPSGTLSGGPFTAGSVLFSTGSNTVGQDNANFFWDSTNHRLGLGNNAPASVLDISNGTVTLRQTGGNFSLTWANPAAARAISIPDPGGTDVFVFAAMTQTLTGKTLTGNVAVTLGPTLAQQHTFPAVASDTIALLAATQTLTNKTLTTPVLTNPALTTQSLAGAATQTINTNNGSAAFVTINQNVTLNAPTNGVSGDILYIKFIHDGTANVYTITWNAVFKRAGGAYSNTNAANAVDTISFLFDGTNWNEIGRALNLS